MAQTYAGRWISLVPGDAPYQAVYAAVTASSALTDNITFSARTELAASKVDGIPVIGLRGPMQPIDGQPASGTATLYVTASRPHLAVRYTEKGTVGTGSAKSTLNFEITFSKWQEAVDVSAPSGAVPFAALGASQGTSPPAPGPTVLT